MSATTTSVGGVEMKDVKLEKPKFSKLDIAMIILAVASLILAAVDIFFIDWVFATFPDWQRVNYSGVETVWYFVIADVIIALIFLTEFSYSATKSGSWKGYTKGHWYDLVGSIPTTAVPGFAAFRLLRIVRIVVVGSRFIRAANYTFGDAVVKRVFDKYRAVIVQELTAPILVAGVTMAQGTLSKGRYAESIGVALDTQRAQIHTLVLDNLKRNPVTAKIMGMSAAERILLAQEKAILDAVIQTLTSDETNSILQASLQTTLEDFKMEVQGKKVPRSLTLSPLAADSPYLQPITPQAREAVRGGGNSGQ